MIRFCGCLECRSHDCIGLIGNSSKQLHASFEKVGVIVDTQLKLQENLREVQAYSSGGDIHCTLPPELGAIPAALEPVSNVNCAQGVQFEVCILQEDACVTCLLVHVSPVCWCMCHLLVHVSPVC